MSPLRSVLRVGSCTLFGVLLAAACADDPSSSSAQAEEPTLSLVSITGAAAGGWRPGDAEGCVELGSDADGTVIVKLRLRGDWELRPYRNCGSRSRCGYIEVTAADASGEIVLRRSAASLSINLPLGPLGAGEYTFSAQLLDQNGEPYLIGDSGTACDGQTCSATLEVQAQCDNPSIPLGPDAAVPEPDAAAPALPDAATLGVDGSSPLQDAGTDAATPVIVDAASNPPDAAAGPDAASDAGDGG